MKRAGISRGSLKSKLLCLVVECLIETSRNSRENILMIFFRLFFSFFFVVVVVFFLSFQFPRFTIFHQRKVQTQAFPFLVEIS